MPSLRAASAVLSPRRKPYPDDPSLLAFYRDLVEPFGDQVDEELLRTSPQVGHTDLIEALVLADGIADSEPDLVIIAQALPDVTPFVAIGPYLDRRLGGGATSFGIHQQGLAAPFTALRAISAYQRSGRSKAAVLAVLEQTTLPIRFDLVHDNDLVDSGALLRFDDVAGLGIEEVSAIAPPESVAERIDQVVVKDPDGTLLVTGPWVDRETLDLPPNHHAADHPGYCTSVWLALAENWRAWERDYAAVALLDTDPRTGVAHLAVLRADGTRQR